MKKLLLLLTLTLSFSMSAGAHAFLDHADPRVGSTIATAPQVIKIWFTEELEGTFSKIEVLDDKGREVDHGDSKVNPDNAALMTVSVGPLNAGTYKVVWQAVATDTHHTTGTFTFTVK